MRRTLPEKIVAAVEALAGDLADWCVAGRDRTLAAHEEAVLERVRQVLPLLGAVVEQATSGWTCGWRTRGRRAPGAAGRRAHGRLRRRQLMTQCGTVALERPR